MEEYKADIIRELELEHNRCQAYFDLMYRTLQFVILHYALMGIIVWAIAKDFALKQIQRIPAETPPSNEDKKLNLSLCLSEYA